MTFFLLLFRQFFQLCNVFLLKLLEGIWPLNPKIETGCGLLAELREMLQPVRLWGENGFRTEHKDQVLKYLQPGYVMTINGITNADNNFRRSGAYQKLHIIRYSYV